MASEKSSKTSTSSSPAKPATKQCNGAAVWLARLSVLALLILAGKWLDMVKVCFRRSSGHIISYSTFSPSVG